MQNIERKKESVPEALAVTVINPNFNVNTLFKAIEG